jgi:hypothetical protein
MPLRMRCQDNARLAFRAAVDLELHRVSHRQFGAQHAAHRLVGFVIHLKEMEFCL